MGRTLSGQFCALAKSESAFSRDFKMFDSTIGARFPNPHIAKGFGHGRVHLWSEDGRMMATGNQSLIVRLHDA